IIIEIKSRAANFDANRKDVLARARVDQADGCGKIRQRGAATLPDQVQQQRIGAQTKRLADIARQAGTKITGASADDQPIDLRGSQARLRDGFAASLQREGRRMLSKARVQNVGREIERV